MKKEDKVMRKCAEAVADIVSKEFAYTDEQILEMQKKVNRNLIEKGYKPIFDV